MESAELLMDYNFNLGELSAFFAPFAVLHL
jgi:hypothetical protein